MIKIYSKNFVKIILKIFLFSQFFIFTKIYTKKNFFEKVILTAVAMKRTAVFKRAAVSEMEVVMENSKNLNEMFFQFLHSTCFFRLITFAKKCYIF